MLGGSGAGDGNRTHVTSLEGWRTAIVLGPRAAIRVPITVLRWLFEVLQLAVAAVVTAALLAFYSRWRASSLRRSVQAGAAVKFNAWLRGNRAPYPRRWREGQVLAGHGAPAWKPRFSVRRRPVTLPVSAVVERIRPVSSAHEVLSVSAN